MLRAGLAAGLRAGARTGRPERWSELEMAAPIPRPLRRLVESTPCSVGGIPGEWTRFAAAAPDAPTVLYLHGGGYVVGNPAAERPLIAGLTVVGHSRTFAVAYRLAPRHPFPAALDDGWAAYHGLLAAGVPPERLVVAGDSAGGGLAVALLVRLRDEGRSLPAGAVLFSPWVDLTNSGATSSANSATDHLGHLPAQGAPLYLGGEDPTHPLASPLFADLVGLPPLLVFAGGRETLLDDAVRLHRRARRAGVQVDLHVEPDMFHAFPVLLPRHPASARTLAVAGEWIGTVVAATPGHPPPGAAPVDSGGSG